MRTTSFIAAAATAAALTTGLAAPAQADSIGVRDRADVHHGVDLRVVEVDHAPRNVWVTLSHTNLRRDPSTGSSGAVYLDTDRNDKGPEAVLVGGFFEGTDYQLLRTDGFGVKKWGEPIEGSYEMKLDYAADQTRIRIGRKALGNPGKVRVAVKVGGQRTDGTQVVDWLRKPFYFTEWVERG